MTELQNNRNPLWYPGLNLDIDYPIASDEELVEAWEAYSDKPAVAVQGAYGVYNLIDSPVQAVASVDLCEVVRDTVVGLDKLIGGQQIRRSNYSEGAWYEALSRGKDYEASVVVSVVQVMMNEGLVEPVEEIDMIARHLKNWRANGIYCIANTSTLPGCELGTIKHTLERDLPGCFDALVLPRNHDGQGKITKAGALSLLASEAKIDLLNVPRVHIDDNSHHVLGFQQHDAGVEVFVPRHGSNGDTPPSAHCTTPLEAFSRATQYFVNQGVINAR